ncbi:MAG TPA: glycerol-3-phosphate dehydrogenase, partial [Ferruginibacter sp.]|nr:glycerol-3-phosphate dehydrogenase [Ferruginibacter sp.]
MNFGILGSGSWGTAIAKILTDNGNTIYWWNRSQDDIDYIRARHHNPRYLPAAHFDIHKLRLTTD